MGVTTGCGCKEVYRFPTYHYSSCICFFNSSILTFCSFFKCFINLLNPQYIIIILNVCNIKLLNPQYIY